MINDLYCLTPTQAAHRNDVTIKASPVSHSVYIRAFTAGKERHSWYVSPDNALTIADALEERGEHKQAEEVRKAEKLARKKMEELIKAGLLVIEE